MMKSGLYFNSTAPGNTDSLVELAQRAEDYNYDTLLIAEPLFGEDLSTQSCDALIEKIVTQTQRIEIGCADRVIALDEPLDLGKRFLAMQNLSKNRFIGGVAVGEDAELFIERAVPFEKCRDLFSEMLDVLPAILDNDPLTHQGRHFQFEKKERPYPDSLAPPVWVCARDYPTQSDAAKQAYPVLPYLLSEHRVVVDQYREFDEMLEREGHSVAEVARPLVRDIFVSSTTSQAYEAALASYVALYQRHAEFGELLDEKNLPKMVDDCTNENLLSHHLLIGDPESVLQQLASLKQQCHYSQIIARMSVPGIAPTATLESMRLFKEQVIPRLEHNHV